MQVVSEKAGVGVTTFDVDEQGVPYAATCVCEDGFVVDAEDVLEVFEWAEDAGLPFTRPELCEQCDNIAHYCSC